MREMKNSGIEWIGDIPSEWNLIKLCYVTDDIFLGKTPIYSEEHNENYTLGQKNNQLYGIDFNGIKFSTDEHFNACKENEFLKYGDILLNSLGTGSVGRIGFFDSNKRMLTDGHIIVIRPNNKINNKYLFYYLRTLRKKFEDDAVGSTNQAFLTVPKIYKTLVPFPDAYMQKKIADFLDEKCAEIDTVIEKTRATIEEYKKLKQSVITQAITKGIRPNRPMKDSKNIWFGNIPFDWEIQKIKYVFTIKKDIAGVEGYTVLSITQRGITPKDLSKNEGQLAENYSKYQLVNIGDFAMNHMDLLTGWVDISKFSGVTSPDYRVFMLNDKNKNSDKFYLYLMQMCYFNRIFYGLGQGVSGMGRWRLQADKFLNFTIPVPPTVEQKEIADYLDKKCSEIDELITKKTSLLSELESYKKSLIYEYVTGKKEV